MSEPHPGTVPAPDPARFRFRGLDPWVELGTASDRYAGWLGQVYSPERYAAQIQSRTKTVGRHRYREEVLPVACVEEYFDHFGVLELDFTFYRPLLDPDGVPSPALRTLAAYRRHLPDNARVLLKVPQSVTAQRIRGPGGFTVNPDYLDPTLFAERFHRPATELLGPLLSGMIFEQEYQRSSERQTPEAAAEEWDRFFAALPRDPRYHLELRTEAYLRPPLFAVLHRWGVGQVLSHWTWLPPLAEQFARGGRRFPGSSGCVVRLMTPRDVRYEDAYARAHPFDRLVPGMLDPHMLADAADLMATASQRRVPTAVIVNNRSGGNAPLVARALAETFLQRGAPAPH